MTEISKLLANRQIFIISQISLVMHLDNRRIFYKTHSVFFLNIYKCETKAGRENSESKLGCYGLKENIFHTYTYAVPLYRTLWFQELDQTNLVFNLNFNE